MLENSSLCLWKMSFSSIYMIARKVASSSPATSRWYIYSPLTFIIQLLSFLSFWFNECINMDLYCLNFIKISLLIDLIISSFYIFSGRLRLSGLNWIVSKMIIRHLMKKLKITKNELLIFWKGQKLKNFHLPRSERHVAKGPHIQFDHLWRAIWGQLEINSYVSKFFFSWKANSWLPLNISGGEQHVSHGLNIGK